MNFNQRIDQFIQWVRGKLWWRVLLTVLFIGYWGLTANILMRPAAPQDAVSSVASFSTIEMARTSSRLRPAWHDAESLPWQPASFPSNWWRIWPNHDGVVWYRTQFTRDAPHLSEQALYLPYAYRAARVFINGHLIGTTTDVWPPESSAWQTPFLWRIPDGVLSTGQNTLRIAVMGEGQTRPGLGAVQLGDIDRLEPVYKKAWINQQQIPFMSTVVFGIIFLVNFVLWLFNRSLSILLLLGLVSLGLSASILFFSPMLSAPFVAWGGFYAPEIICQMGYALVGPAIVSCNLRLDNLRFPILENICWGVGLSTIAYLLVTAPHINYTLRVVCALQALLVPSLAAFIGLWRMMRPNLNFNVRFLYLVQIGVPMIAMIDVARYLDLFAGHEMYHSTILVLEFSSGSVVLMWYFLQSAFNEKVYNLKLAEDIQTTQNDLFETKKKQHEAEINIMRLKARTSMWLDIHDSFSNILERLEQVISHGNGNKQQLLTRLTAMRADLRNVLQHHSDEGEVNLETTLASIRREMLGRLDALDVQYTWHIENDRVISHRMHLLLPMIVREALTNVIRHSAAKNVYCNFCFTDSHLHCVIEDDGRSAISQVTYGLGLSCMQMQIESLGGVLHWQGTPHGVTVTFDIPLEAPVEPDTTNNVPS